MKWIRKLLFPFTLLYAAIISVRNFLYDRGWKKSTSFLFPVIAVGNLSVGGTGKTPMVEYLIRLLQDDYQLAILSRGYKRKSKGFLLAGSRSTVEELGDEPFQYAKKFHKIHVAVEADRVAGVEELLKVKPETEIVLLDDAFQHRKIRAGFYILLTAYHDLYVDDVILPAGNLRESRSGAKRADALVVTKCPPDLSVEEQAKLKTKLKFHKQDAVFFTKISYAVQIENTGQSLALNTIQPNFIFAVAGIARPGLFFQHLNVSVQNQIVFPDHHFYTLKDAENIRKKAQGKVIITTEKDYVRLHTFFSEEELFYLPIQTHFLNNENIFQNKIQDYVGKSKRNGSLPE